MPSCLHLSIEVREVVEDDMHYSGWTCPSCNHLASGECHHQSWCRQDFCGAEPLLLESPRRVLIEA